MPNKQRKNLNTSFLLSNKSLFCCFERLECITNISLFQIDIFLTNHLHLKSKSHSFFCFFKKLRTHTRKTNTKLNECSDSNPYNAIFNMYNEAGGFISILLRSRTDCCCCCFVNDWLNSLFSCWGQKIN